MSVDLLYGLLSVASLTVIVGVILEGIEHVGEFREKGWKPILPKLGFGLLVLGLAGELVFQTLIFSAESALKRESDIKIADLKHETETLRQANLTMEAAVSPRNLEEGLTFAALRQFSDIAVLVVSPSDFEPKRTAGYIRFMLNMAGWKRFTGLIRPLPFFDGVIVHVILGANEMRAYAAANALVSILKDNNIETRSAAPIPRIGRKPR